jgi:hypothetical protein
MIARFLNRRFAMKLIATNSFAFVLVSLLQAVPASALNDRSWISPTGDNSNSCDVADPCRNFSGALAKTEAGGEIICLTSGSYGSLTITKSITVNCDGHIANMGDSPTGLGAGLINVASTDKVILRGLDLNMDNAGAFASAVSFVGAGTLVMEHVKVSSNSAGSGSRSGIAFTPNGPGKLIVIDSVITDTGSAAFGGAGLLVKPQAGGTAQVMLERVSVSANTFGIAVDGTGSTGGINMTVADSVLSANSQGGLVATTPAGGAPIGVMVTNTRSVNNAFGLRSIGPNVTVRVDSSKIVGNSTGLSFSGGGALLIFGNNAVRANGSDGSFSGSLVLQ